MNISSWRTKDPREVLFEYMRICRDLMYSDERTVRNVTETLRENIARWASQKCDVYRRKSGVISKSDLEDKDIWYVRDLEHEWQRTSTSGSTTGVPFSYLRWAPSFDFIEWGNHYDLVLDEFNVPQRPHVMYFFSDYYKKEEGKFITRHGKSPIMLNNHGMARDPVVHHVNFEMFKNDPGGFFFFLFEYVRNNPIDVLFTSGPQIRSMCNYAAKFGVGHRIGGLLSNTNEKLMNDDVIFLTYDNSLFGAVCDHMRCWDGGAGFFTCAYGNYHLTDNLGWCEESDGKLVCTDYFNLCSPFVRYWNGDYCRIDSKYQRCECGRLFRDFEFMESRPFSIKGVNMRELQNRIAGLGIEAITQVKCSVHFIDVVSDRELTLEEKSAISSTSDLFQFKFNVESEYKG